MRQIFTFLFVLVFGQSVHAQYGGSPVNLKAHNQIVSTLLGHNTVHNAALKTTAGVLTQRVVAQSTRDHALGTLSDSVRLRYTGMRGSTYDYNSMIYAYNYPYSTTPMFNYAGVFTTPQVLCDTYVHWTINPFAMPAYQLYEWAISTHDTNNNLTTYKKLFVDSATNDNLSYSNTFTTTQKINSGFWFNLNAGVADSAFKQYFAYSTSDKLIKDSVYEKHLGVWRIAARTNYTYDASGNLVQIDHFANVSDTSFLLPLIQQSKYVNTYDASNRLKTVQTSLHNGTALAAYVRDTFGYSGALTYHNSWKQHQFDPINGTWKPQYFMSKTITADKPDTVFHKGWDSIANSWVPISREKLSYNADGNPDSMFNYAWNWTSYSTTPDYTTVYYYDTFTLVIPTTEVYTIANSAINIYPNPANNSLTISLADAPGNEVLTLSIYNVNGQIMSRQAMRGNKEMQLSVENLIPGMYWLAIQDKTGTAIQRKQFVKQ